MLAPLWVFLFQLYLYGVRKQKEGVWAWSYMLTEMVEGIKLRHRHKDFHEEGVELMLQVNNMQ